MVEMMREILDEGLSHREKNAIDKSYLALEKMIGVNKEPATDTASTIDQALYGEDGPWKGEHE